MKQEVLTLKKEQDFLQRNREDLEIALQATQEEKQMINRELTALRAQLTLKANGNI